MKTYEVTLFVLGLPYNENPYGDTYELCCFIYQKAKEDYY